MKNIINGWLIIDKPEGITSAKLVSKVKKLTGAKKVGHAGTLDPFASGILPLALGEATKTVQYCTDSDKIYEFEVTFGEARDTDDRDGKVTAAGGKIPSESEIIKVLPEFLGEINQVPPIYSAIKINGKRAYDLARQGGKAELKSRKVTVYDLQLLSRNLERRTQNPEYSFCLHCSKGTYVRSVARDIASRLGTYAYVSRLRRKKVGKFDEKAIISLDNLEKIVYKGDLIDVLLPVETVLDDFPVLKVGSDEAQALKQGRIIKLSQNNQNKPGRVCIKASGKLLAIGLIQDNQDNMIVKPTKVFNL